MLDLAAEYRGMQSEIRNAVDSVLESQKFINGPQVEQLEEAVARRAGTDFAVAISNGTDALLVALMGLGIGPGDEVITTPFTFFATAGSIHRVGAKPVFVDVEADTYNIDPSAIEAAVTSRTRAIIPVHLFGQCTDTDAINRVARRHNLPVIEDAAQAIGSTYRGQPAGSLGTIASFSFYPTKNLGGFGEGGMVTTNDEELATRCRQLRNHGQTDRYHHAMVGGNFRLDTIKAAILLVKLARLDEFTKARRENACRYDGLLGAIPQINTPVVRPECFHTYHQYSITCECRNELQRHLSQMKIGSGIYYPVPLHLQPCFAELGYTEGDLPVSESLAERILSLPVHPMLTPDDIERVAGNLAEFYATSSVSPSLPT